MLIPLNILAATGHRPNKLGGYNNFDKLVWFAECELKIRTPKFVISGMALGWDQAIAKAAVNLKISLIAAIPFKGQENIWPNSSKRLYKELLAEALDIVTVSDGGYAANKMQVRNEWMVDHGDYVLALWNGSSGGTANCVKYAKRNDKIVINCWDNWSNAN